MTLIDLKGKTRINLGSGKSTVLYPSLKESHFNVDVRAYEGTDLIADMRSLEFNDETFEDILISDCLDHVTYFEAKILLRKFSQWLKSKGTLQIHTPNLRFLAVALSQGDYHEELKWLYGTDGEGSTNYDSNVIRWCYSKEELKRLVELNGLKIINLGEDCGGFAFRLIAQKI